MGDYIHIYKHRRGTAEQWKNSEIIPEEAELVVELDEEHYKHKLKLGDGIHTYDELSYLTAGEETVTQTLTRTVSVTLYASAWEEITCETDPNIGYYKQTLDIDGINPNSKVDLQPTADMIAVFQSKNLAFVTETIIENDIPVIVCYSIGSIPSSDYTLQATVTEVEVDGNKIIGNTVSTIPNLDDYATKEYVEELVGCESSIITQEGSIIALQNITSENITVTCSNSTLEDISAETIISCGKNLLKNTASNKTSQGITFTKSNSGVSVVGTATANSFYYPNENFYLPAGNYRLSGCPNGGSASTYYLSIQKVENGATSLIGRDFGNGLDFTVPEDVTLKVFIGIVSGQTVDLNFKPMIELASVATGEYEPYTEMTYAVDGSGSVSNVVFNPPITVLYGSTANTILTVTSGQQESCIDILQGWREAAYGKIDNLFEQATAAPIITFIDDDTTDLAAVQRFKNTCDELGIVGGFAVVTSNLDSQPELAEALQEYEKEGFHMCLHCDVHDRFYAPATRDYTQCRSDFVTGIRKMKKYQFADPMFWCIPYGSPDKEMEDMAKKWGMECLVASGCNSYETTEARYGRFALRRCSLNPTDDNGYVTTLDRLKQLVRMTVAENGWLLITTHFTEDGWIDNQDRFRELVNYAIAQGMQVKTLNEAYRIREPIYRLYEAF